MALKLKTAPTLEPISKTEAKLHLKLDSESFADNIVINQSITPGDHVIAASYSLVGTAINVLGKNVVVNLNSGANGTGGTVDVKLQDSDDGTTYTDVANGAFTQVTESNDNAVQEKTYTGGKHYLKAVATVGVATCDFGVDIIVSDSDTTEDNELDIIIGTAREYCEGFQNRAYLEQTWELWLDEFPEDDYIKLPLPPLYCPAITAGAFVTGVTYRILSIGTTDFTLIGAAANTVGVVFTATGAGTGTGTATASVIISYYGTDNTVYYMDAGDYTIDDKDQFEPKVFLNYGESWPSTTLRPHNGVCVTFIAGYGATASSVPLKVKQAMLLLIGHLYEHREAVTDKQLTNAPLAVDSLLWQERVL